MQMLLIKQLGLTDHHQTWQEMRNFSKNRNSDSCDEIWLTEHFPVFTLGNAADPSHLLQNTDIPVIKTDRGGQITFHAPGQQIMYILFDFKRLKNNGKIGSVRDLVSSLEQTVIKTLADLNIEGHTQKNAPGVYVDGKKICSLGLKITSNYTYHGLALNVDMDLIPFSKINPCGYEGLLMTQVKDLTDSSFDKSLICNYLVQHCANILGYNALKFL